MNRWNAGQILSAVRTINKMDINYLGPDDITQNQTLFQFMNIALWNLVRLAYNTETSDVINLTADGPVTFKKGNTDIIDMFEPLRMIEIRPDGTEGEAQKRYSESYPVGWYRESENQPIHCRGLRGNHKFVYIRYPRQVTQEDDPVDMPEVGYKALIMEISALVKNVKNFYEEANAMAANAKTGYSVITQAAISARGPGGSSGQPPSFEDVKQVRGG